jgi:hypothetical protein
LRNPHFLRAIAYGAASQIPQRHFVIAVGTPSVTFSTSNSELQTPNSGYTYYLFLELSLVLLLLIRRQNPLTTLN